MRYLAAALVAVAGIGASTWMVLTGGIGNAFFGIVVLIVSCAMATSLSGDSDK